MAKGKKRLATTKAIGALVVLFGLGAVGFLADAVSLLSAIGIAGFLAVLGGIGSAVVAWESLRRHWRVAITIILALVSVGCFVVAVGSFYVRPDGSTASGPADTGIPHGCDLVARSEGNDGADGRPGSPFKSIERLMASLGPGQTGCLGPGEYRSERIVLDQHAVELRSLDFGAPARLHGTVELLAEATRLAGLVVDSSMASEPSPAVQISANKAQLLDTEITTRTNGKCVVVAAEEPSSPRDVEIVGNRIHHCGWLPSTNSGFAVDVRTGEGIRLVDNLIYGAIDTAINLYPGPQGVEIAHNTLDGNGTGIQIGGTTTVATSGALVANNVISNSNRRWNVEVYWEGSTGSNNVVRSNCIFATNQDDYYNENGGLAKQVGFRAEGNIVADPRFVGTDYRLAADSVCAGKGRRR